MGEPSYVKTAKLEFYFSPHKLGAFGEVGFGFAVHTILSIKHKKGCLNETAPLL